MYEKQIDGFIFSTDKNRLNIPFIHQFLCNESYWAKGIPVDVVQRSIDNSLTVGIYFEDEQIGFARVITDYATFGYLADVFVNSLFRGKGVSKHLMEFIVGIHELKGLRRMILATRDAHTLYGKYGFVPLKSPQNFMEIHQPDVYAKTSA